MFRNIESESFKSTSSFFSKLADYKAANLMNSYTDNLITFTWPLLGKVIFWNSLSLGTPPVAACCISSLRPFLYVFIEKK